MRKSSKRTIKNSKGAQLEDRIAPGGLGMPGADSEVPAPYSEGGEYVGDHSYDNQNMDDQGFFCPYGHIDESPLMQALGAYESQENGYMLEFQLSQDGQYDAQANTILFSGESAQAILEARDNIYAQIEQYHQNHPEDTYHQHHDHNDHHGEHHEHDHQEHDGEHQGPLDFITENDDGTVNIVLTEGSYVEDDIVHVAEDEPHDEHQEMGISPGPFDLEGEDQQSNEPALVSNDMNTDDISPGPYDIQESEISPGPFDLSGEDGCPDVDCDGIPPFAEPLVNALNGQAVEQNEYMFQFQMPADGTYDAEANTITFTGETAQAVIDSQAGLQAYYADKDQGEPHNYADDQHGQHESQENGASYDFISENEDGSVTMELTEGTQVTEEGTVFVANDMDGPHHQMDGEQQQQDHQMGGEHQQEQAEA